MLQDWEKLAAVFDWHQPGWFIKWADQEDLRAFASKMLNSKMLKERVAYDLFHPILHAALEAGLIAEAPGTVQH